jgi:hypothetical protein
MMGSLHIRQGTGFFLVLIVLMGFIANPGLAQEKTVFIPPMTGLSLNLGYTYDPCDNIWFSQATFIKLYDYDQIWPHKAPAALRFKIEGSLGTSRLDNSDIRLNTGAAVLALYYLDRFETGSIKPYVEAGVGILYTDYQVDGQDYRFNFNPQAGLGMEIKRKNAASWFLGVRLHHISNGGLGSSNRGQNSVVFLAGQYF